MPPDLTSPSPAASPWRPRLLAALVGILAGTTSGLFGIGGGTIIVPGLIALAGMSQRRAHGTSLAAVLPIAIAASVSYARGGAIDFLAVLPLAVGSIAGAVYGSRLLARIQERRLKLVFAAFLLVIAVQLVVGSTPTGTESPTARGPLVLLALVALGFATGTSAGLLGIGGGTIVVPGLILLLSVSDLVAKGISLALIVPTSIAGTVTNVRSGNADLELAAWVGIAGVVTSYLSGVFAQTLDPAISVPLFAGFLVIVAVRMALQARRRPDPDVPPTAE